MKTLILAMEMIIKNSKAIREHRAEPVRYTPVAKRNNYDTNTILRRAAAHA